ncbi:MAG: hypothetical protein EOP02_37780 [Proteobacteria bacterium]|nr:MAG: hypothetical protein EOP02_37780 [Pseudomonadota bacterium]
MRSGACAALIMGRSVEVRRAGIEDLAEVAGLFALYRQFYRQAADLAGARAFLSERLERDQSVIFMALDGAEPVGFAQLFPSFSSAVMARTFILNDLYVAKRSRGRGLNLAGQDILWVDYDAAVSLHRMSDRKPGLTAKGRLDRLESATTRDNRISHGCINVSVSFYEDFIEPSFEGAAGIVYVLPETRSVREEFNIPA